MPISRIAASVTLLILIAGSAESADPAPGNYEAVPVSTPVKPTANQSAPRRDDFAARQQRLQHQQAMQQRIQEANRPTAWQMQNPSNPQNRIPTSSELPGYVAPNTYFGPQFRTWNNQSAPVTQSQPPANISPSLPLIQSNAMIAPYSYWGGGNARWSNVTTVTPQPSPFGSWTIAPGW
jgi:hypothetical protein